MPIDLEQLENLHQSTTPGPWTVRRAPANFHMGGADGFIEAPRLRPEDAHAIEILGEDTTLYPNRDDDMAWIVAAHEAFPALIDELHAWRTLAANMVRHVVTPETR